MYALLVSYFVGTTRAQFESRSRRKRSGHCVARCGERPDSRLLNADADRGLASTGARSSRSFPAIRLSPQQYWGESDAKPAVEPDGFRRSRSHLGETAVEHGLYWFLICSGYKTWRFLPVFFRDFYPNPEAPTPSHVKHILDTLGDVKFGSQYNAGTVSFAFARPHRFAAASPMSPSSACVIRASHFSPRGTPDTRMATNSPA